MLKRLRDKRGAVMESALLFLLIIFLLCFLLTLVALGGNAENKLSKVKLENRLVLDGIAEDFMTDPAHYADPDATDAYAVAVVGDGGIYTLTVTHKDADPAAVLLTVQVDAAGRVLAYRYGAMTVTP